MQRMRLELVTWIECVGCALGFFLALLFFASAAAPSFPPPAAAVYNVTSVSPVSGFTSGGTSLTVYGNGFEPPSDKTMNLPPKLSLVEADTGKEFECGAVKYISEWELVCTTPPHPPAEMCVRVQLRSKGMEGSYTLCKPFRYQ